MKDKFIEKDGLLFLMCEPEPLELDSKMPCLAQPIQDDSRMGKINRISFKNNLERFVIHDMVNYISDGYYLRFEIIAKHCSEGSSEWALWQMLNGKKVKHERDATNYYYMDKNGMLVSKGEQIIEDESRWLKTSSRNGWKIYEETKPEVGKWYINKPSKKYYQHDSTSESNGYRFRQAGSTIFDMIGNSCFLEEFELAPIEPDFSNAKTGDKCYSTLVGDMEISCVYHQEKYGVKAYHEKSGLSACYTNSGFYDKHHIHIHPALFNSAAQCAAYFAEVALEERGGE